MGREVCAVRGKKLLLAVLAAAMTLVLTGCFVKTVDELYALPKHSDSYNRLESAIERVLASQSASYAAPVSGINQQSVQLADLDGDGTEEAIAFLKTADERPLKAYIFAEVDGEYQPKGVIEGSGTSFASVEYVPLTGRPGVDIVLGRQLSTDVMQSLCAYSYVNGNVVELMSANYTQYRTVDLDGDGRKDIFILRFDAEQRQGVAELYRWSSGQLEREPEASLSTGATEVKRIISGNLMTDVPAVFVAGTYGETGLATDVFAFRDGVFQNITAADSGVSTQTVRSYYVYAVDIDGDGLIELPQIRPLPPDGAQEEGYSLICWLYLELQGVSTPKLTTYHNFSGGWYLVLPDSWLEQLRISRSEEVSEIRGYVFSRQTDSGQPEQLFTIYAFSGDNRVQTASSDGRFLLAEKGDIAYAAQLGTGARGLTQEKLKDMFHFIHIDWNSGET